MRCPHCAGEVLDGSRFCGICGREIAIAPVRPVQHPARPASARAPAPPAGSQSAIELPVSPGTRWARILAILTLDVVLAGVGLIMILSHVRGCKAARSTPAISSEHEPPGAPKARK